MNNGKKKPDAIINRVMAELEKHGEIATWDQWWAAAALVCRDKAQMYHVRQDMMRRGMVERCVRIVKQ